MLQLKDVVKKYGEKENVVTALNGVNITFRENEFVAVLGHSGCGKTTMLNIIGGLDHCTSGDLIINGVSTKKFKDRDWDAYRNISIGFIFQSYNLIPHQTVLSNVELALTISGVSKSERRKRAKEALEKVGLGDQLYKKPNQMSGGQMQRVAIARALINNPDILLVDEPTGALDSETSIQVMELLKEIANDRLVILVTHNPELAEEYATRIVRVKDGAIVSDTDPCEPPKTDGEKTAKKKRVSMSFFTAVSLSLNNLLTKKGRTLLTSFAGSIGIIGIALILSLSTGINSYINTVQEETLSSYPIDILKETTDLGSLFGAVMDRDTGSSDDEGDEEEAPAQETVRANTNIYEVFNALNSSARQTNNLAAFKEFVDSSDKIQKYASAVSYSYNVQMPVFTQEESGNILKVDLAEVMSNTTGMSSVFQSGSNAMMMSSMKMWEELLPAEDGTPVNDILKNQYDLVYGSWPQNYDEIVIVLTRRNQLPDIVMYTLGLKDTEVLPELMRKVMTGEVVDDYGKVEWTYQELCEKEYKLILPCEYYQAVEGGKGYVNLTENETGIEYLYNSEDVGVKLKIVGFIRPNEEATATMLSGYIGYTKNLTEYVIEKTNGSEIVKQQMEDPDTDIIAGVPFKNDEYVAPTIAEMRAKVGEFLSGLSISEKADIYKFIMMLPDEAKAMEFAMPYLSQYSHEELVQMVAGMYAESMGVDPETILSYIGEMDEDTLFGYVAQAMYTQNIEQLLAVRTLEELAAALDMTDISDEQYEALFENYTPDEFSDSNYDDVLSELGYADPDNPDSVHIYAKTFEDKDRIAEAIADYNKSVDEEDEIKYTDYVALLMSSITDIISGISYLLIAFVGISLVVSSIMIGIITYISVLERTREIGILRAIGASKHDVSTVFNAETLIVGLVSGVIGIGVSLLLIIPINAILYALTEIEGLRAALPVMGAVILVAISMILTLIAGIIPSRVAAKKDPVEALRTE